MATKSKKKAAKRAKLKVLTVYGKVMLSKDDLLPDKPIKTSKKINEVH